MKFKCGVRLVRIFQFIPLRRPKTTGRLLKPFRNTENVAVFDLEDSFWVPESTQRSQELKARARQEIVRFCLDAGDHHGGIRFGVRVNPIGSDCFRSDLEVVKVLRESLTLDFLILPKVERGREVEICQTALWQKGIPELEVVPIIETRGAFDVLDHALVAFRKAGVRSVMYGHHDYSLDAGHWPVSRADSIEYWEIVGSVLGRIENAGLNYIHPPIPDLNDASLLRASLARLLSVASRELAILSAGPSQSAVLSSLLRESSTAGEMMPLRRNALLPESEKLRLAHQVKELFESNKRPEFSFAVDARTGRFISPHEYLAALKYLWAREGSDS